MYLHLVMYQTQYLVTSAIFMILTVMGTHGTCPLGAQGSGQLFVWKAALSLDVAITGMIGPVIVMRSPISIPEFLCPTVPSSFIAYTILFF